MMSKPHGMLYHCPNPLTVLYLTSIAVKKEFPNNWQAVSDTPSDEFAEIEYELFMQMLMMWEIPSSHCCIMRCENKRTGKISEFSYQKLHAAKSRLVTLAQDEDNEILVADDETIALFKKSNNQPDFLFDDPID